MERKLIARILRWPKLIYQLFFTPNAFNENAVQHTTEDQFQKNTQLAEQYPDRLLPEEMLNDWRSKHRKRTDLIRVTVAKSLTICILTLFLARMTFQIFPMGAKYYFISSALILLWSVLGVLGWEIQTYGGRSLPEQANKVWYRSLHVIGMYLLFVAIFQSF